MPTITFIYSGNNVAITAPTVYATKFYEEALGQTNLETGEGTLVVKNSTPIILIKGVLVFKNVDYTDGELLRTWIREQIVYGQNSFNISSDSAESDLGHGKGVDLVNNPIYIYLCTLPQNSDEGIFNHKAPKRYDIKFPYNLLIGEILL